MSDPPPLPKRLSGGAVLWWVIKGQWRRLALGMIIGTAWMAMLALTPVALGQAIDQGISTRSWTRFAEWLVVILVLGGANAMLWILRHQITTGNGRRATGWLERSVAARALNEAGGLDGRVTAGEIVSIVASDSRRIARFVEALARGAGAVVTFVCVATAMFIVSSELALSILAILVPFLTMIVMVVHRLEQHSQAQQASLATAASVAGDAITGLRVVRGIGGTAEMERRYSRESSNTLRAGVRAARTQALSSSLAVAMPGTVIAIIGWEGGRQALAGQLNPGQLVTFSAWAIFLVTPLLTFDEIARRFALAHAAATRIGAVLATPLAIDVAASRDPVIEDPPAGGVRPRNWVLASEASRKHVDADLTYPRKLIDVRDGRPTISCEAVDVAGHGERMSLHGFTVEFEAGRFSVVVADHLAAAALVDVLGRMREPDSGKVLLEGVDVQLMALAEVRATLVVAEHDAVLFEGSLRRNLCVGKPTATDREMLESMHVAAADDILQSLRGQLDGVVSERGRSLSGGQRQRLALARVMLADPPILVLVEPTSAVDAYTESEIVDRLHKRREGKTTIVITSSPALLDRADTVIVVEGGVVMARGTHASLLAGDSSYAARFGGEEATGTVNS